MGLRYEEVTSTALNLLKTVRAKDFPELKNAKIKVLFDLKKRKSGGRIVLGRIMKTNDLIRHLTKDEVEVIEGFDYIITLDKKCWDNTTDEDRTRILRHELRHTFFDIEAEKDPYKLMTHSISDFYEEVELNQKDPRWRERVAILTEDIYEQEKEAQAEKRRKKKDRE
ncbi:MAG TPA: putative metallopeptidase [Syntrophorhabdaceae bacterium]|nr:putative metallopeptidase [Syntrophorhabdaceae bacterium]